MNDSKQPIKPWAQSHVEENRGHTAYMRLDGPDDCDDCDAKGPLHDLVDGLFSPLSLNGLRIDYNIASGNAAVSANKPFTTDNLDLYFRRRGAKSDGE